MPIVVYAATHKTAPVEIRGDLAIPERDLPTELDRLSALPAVKECVILSTCNRSEFYVVTDSVDDSRAGVLEILGRMGDLTREALAGYLFELQDDAAVTHLFGVAAGLDSMIMGENQIAGQVKSAAASALALRTSGTILNRLFRTATEASKRARSETEIGVGAVSVSFAAVELAKKILGDLEGRTALVMGAGEMSELTAIHLKENGVKELRVASRTRARAQALADKVSGVELAWDEAMATLHEVDVLISSTSAPYHIVRKDVVAEAMQKRRNRSMFLIDIAVPPDVEPAVGDLYNVFVYNIDDLKAVVDANLAKRQKEAEQVQVIVQQESAGFVEWLGTLEVQPAIVALREHFFSIMESELQRAKLDELSDPQKERVVELMRRTLNKLLHLPMTKLREASHSEDGSARVDVVRELFALSPNGREKNEKPSALPSPGSGDGRQIERARS